MLAGLLMIQLAQPLKNTATMTAGKAFVDTFKVSKKINALLTASCYDCHSNNTAYPWYSEFQPMAWLISKHINDGKEKLNFDELPSYGMRRRNSKFTQIIKRIEQDEMPLKSYLWLHNGAQLSRTDKKLLINYFNLLVEEQKAP